MSDLDKIINIFNEIGIKFREIKTNEQVLIDIEVDKIYLCFYKGKYGYSGCWCVTD